MQEHLRPTYYCDHHHSRIQTAAAELTSGNEDPMAIAMRTFYYVRDGIRYGFDRYRRRASETLSRGYGVCWNKSLLLVTLLRCNRIPARLASIPVKRSFCKPTLGRWHRLANHPFHHCVVQALVNNRWTLLDPVLDKPTFNAFFLPAGVKWGIDFDGRQDVRLYTESILGPPVIHPDIDTTLEEKVGNRELPGYLATIGYRHVNRQIWKKAGARLAIR